MDEGALRPPKASWFMVMRSLSLGLVYCKCTDGLNVASPAGTPRTAAGAGVGVVVEVGTITSMVELDDQKMLVRWTVRQGLMELMVKGTGTKKPSVIYHRRIASSVLA